MEITTNTFDNYPDWVLEKWQGIADLLAEIIDIPAALIMKSDNEFIEVFISSHSENNPYSVGNKEKSYGLYCETVIKTQNKLLVPNATKDKVWSRNPDIKLGMIAYLGFPLNFPNGQPFGTLCVLDNKERPFSLLNEKLILQFKNVIELDLALMQSFDLKTRQLAANEIQEINDRKQTENALKEIELKYHSLIENSSDAIFCVDENGEYKFVNQLFASTFGKNADYFIGKTFWDIYDKEHADQRYEATKRLFQSGESESLEVEVPLADRTLYFLATTNPIKDETGKVVLNFTHAADITELKKIEKALNESHQFNSQIINSQQVGIIVFDRDLRYRVWNPFMEKLTATPASQVIGKHISELFPFLKDAGITAKVEKALIGEFPCDGDFPFQFFDSGILAWSSYLISPLMGSSGEIIGVIVNVHDISLIKQTEEKIRNNETKLINAIDIAKLGPWEYDLASDIFTFNDHFYSVFHTTVEQEGGYTMTSAQYTQRFVHPDDVILVGNEIQNAIKATDPNFSRNIEHRCIYSDGEIGYISVHFYIIKDAQGRTVKTYGVNKDITERKQDEQNILRHTNELSTLLQISKELSETLNLQSILQLTTDRATELTEMKTSALYLLEGETIRLWATTPPLPQQFPEELRNAPLADHTHIRKVITSGIPYFLQDTATSALTPAERAVTEIRGLRSILYLPLKAGTKVMGALILSSIQKPLCLSDEEINLCNTLANLAALAVINAQLFDSEQTYATKLREQVAELVQAKEKLKISEQRYRDLFNLANEGLILLTMDGKIAELNQSFADMHGYTVDEMKNMDIKDLDVLRENTFDGRAAVMQRIFNGEVVRFEVEHYHKNGHSLILSDTVSIITIEGQQYFLAFHQDITDRKLTEEKLKDSELKYKALFESNTDGITIFALKGDELPTQILDMNQSSFKMLGYSKEEMLLINPAELEKEITREKIEKRVVDFKTKGFSNFETKLRHKKGFDIYVEIKAIIVNYNNQPALMNIVRDITERKQAESILQDIIDKNPMSIQIVDAEGFTIKVNPSHTALFGAVPPPDFSIFNDLESRSPELEKLIKQAKSGEVVHFPDYYYNVHDVSPEFPDKPVWIHAILFPLKDSTGKFEKLVLMHENITWRKHAEELLLESEQKFREIYNSTNEAILINDAITGQMIDCNQRAVEIYGYATKEEILRGNIVALGSNMDPFTDEKVQNKIRKTIEEGNHTFEWLAKRKNGELFFVEVSLKITEIGGRKTILSVVRDITERKLAEDKIREKDIQFRKLSANVSDLIFQFTRKPDGSYFVPIASEGIRNIFGCSPEDVLDDFTPISGVIYPDDANRVFSDIEDSAKHLTYFTCEFRVQIPGKDIQWIYSRSTPEKLPDGSITWYGFNTDITERKRAEEELKQMSARFSLAVRAGGVGIWDYDIVNNNIYWDDQMFALYGINKRDFGGVYETWRSGLHPEDTMRGDAEIQMAIRGEKEFDTEFRIVWPDGSIHTIKALASIQRNKDGQAERMIGTNWDITEQKNTEKELIAAKENAEENENELPRRRAAGYH
jgi:PAS domain S-box-containing protein